jgi:hypothetical protein
MICNGINIVLFRRCNQTMINHVVEHFNICNNSVITIQDSIVEYGLISNGLDNRVFDIGVYLYDTLTTNEKFNKTLIFDRCDIKKLVLLKYSCDELSVNFYDSTIDKIIVNRRIPISIDGEMINYGSKNKHHLSTGLMKSMSTISPYDSENIARNEKIMYFKNYPSIVNILRNEFDGNSTAMKGLLLHTDHCLYGYLQYKMRNNMTIYGEHNELTYPYLDNELHRAFVVDRDEYYKNIHSDYPVHIAYIE